MKLADYHIHTAWCGHATGQMEEYVLRAVELGLPEMGFSEHLPAEIPIADKVCPTPDEMEKLLDEFHRLRTAYAGKLALRLGGEADFFPGNEMNVERMKADYKLEYVIGSVHFIDGWAFDHPDYVDGFSARSVEAVYRGYFELVARAADTRLFDYIGHLDLPKKFGHRPNGGCLRFAENAIARMAATGTGFEINTAGKDKPVGEFYPSKELVVACREAGVKLTFGSDSHAPEQVGRYFDAARDLATAAGYTHAIRMNPGRDAVEL